MLAFLACLPACGPPASSADVAAPTYSLDRISFPFPHQISIDGEPRVERQVASILNVPAPLHYGQFVWNDRGAQSGKVWILVNLETQTISVFRGQHEVGTAIALYGVDGKPTPLGRYKVLDMRKDHQSSIYDAEMPFTLRLTNDGIAIHGSDVQAGVGTHGCIGIPLGFASKLFATAQVGTEVFVVRRAGGSAPAPALVSALTAG